MLFSGKKNVFMCLVVFQKIFRKIFSGVWKMLQGKDKTRKTNTAPKLTLDWARQRGASRAPVWWPRRWSRSREAPRRFARSRSTARSCEASIAISAKARLRSTVWSREASIAISRSTTPIAIGVKASLQSRIAIDGAGACERRRLQLGCANGADWLCFSLSCSRSLSLSLWNSFEVKIGTEIHFRSQSLFFFFGQRKSISGKFYFPDQPNTRISEKAFPEMIFTQNKHSLSHCPRNGILTLEALHHFFSLSVVRPSHACSAFH